MLWSTDSRTIIHVRSPWAPVHVQATELLVDIVRTASLLLLTFSPAVAFFLSLTLLFLR